MFNPKNANWGCTCETRPLVDQLSKLDIFPSQGPVKPLKGNHALEKFRKAQNVVYDIFNNGLMNRARELRVLGLRKYDLALEEYNNGRLIRETNWDSIEEVVEEAFTPIVLAAAQEQGILDG